MTGMYDPEFTQADIEFNTHTTQKPMDFDMSGFRSFGAAMEEGFAANPLSALASYVGGTIKGSMTAQEANEKYNLTGTDHAFPDDAVDISDDHAQMVKRKMTRSALNQTIMDSYSAQEGWVGSITNFAGSMGGGMIDPFTLTLGAATSTVFKGFGSWASKNLLADITAGRMTSKAVSNELAESFTTGVLKKAISVSEGKTVGTLATREFADNFAASVVTDSFILPLGEEATNKEISTKQRIYGILGSTLLGGTIGTAMGLPAIRQARMSADAIAKSVGDKSEEVVARVQKKAAFDAQRGVKGNPDHEYEMIDMENHWDRPNQEAYVDVEVTAENVSQRSYYISVDSVKRELDNPSFRGEGTFVIVDNFNLSHNRVASLDGKKTGEVYEFSLTEKAKIMTEDAFDVTKHEIRKNILEIYNAHGAHKGNIETRLNEIVNDARNVDQLKDFMHDKLFSDFKGVPELDDWVNQALYKAGFDGYHFNRSAATNAELSYNGITMFKREFFDPKHKRKNTIGFGRPSKTGSIRTSLKKDKETIKLFKKNQRIKANLDTAKKNLRETRTRVDEIEAEIKKLTPKKNEIATNEQVFALDKAKAELETAKAELETARTNLTKAKEAVPPAGVEQRVGVDSIKRNEALHYDRQLLQGHKSIETSKLDLLKKEHRDFVQKFKDKELTEFNRGNAVEQQIGFDANAVNKLADGKAPEGKAFEPFQAMEESIGADVTALRTHIEEGGSVPQVVKDALEESAAKIKARDKHMDLLANCVLGD